MLVEKDIKGLSGWLMLALLPAVSISSLTLLVRAIKAGNGGLILLWLVVLAAALLCLFGLTVVNPNQAKVVQVFGTYKGSLKEQGFWWVNPISTRRRVSLRIRNFESSKLKVNDQDGNP